MPLEYKPNFTSASGGGGFVTGYHGTPDSFNQQDAPDFEGAMKTLVGAVKDFRDDAFEQGQLDQIAGEIDNNKILFKDAYLAGAEYATSFQKMAEFQAFVADESNKALGRGESAEEFYTRISPKIAEYRDSYAKIKQVNPEAGSLLTRNLMNVATGALQNYGTARLERAYEHRRAGSVTTATSAILGPLNNPNVNPEMIQGALLQTVNALREDANSMGLNPEEYLTDIFNVSFKNVVTGFNFNEPTHRAWINVVDSTVRKMIDGGVMDRAKSTELLTLLQGRVKEATGAGIQSIVLDSYTLSNAGKYTDEMHADHKAQLTAAIRQGADIRTVTGALTAIDKNWANSNKDANILNTVPTDTDAQNRQANAFAKKHQGESPATLIKNIASTTALTKNPKIAEQHMPLYADGLITLMSRDPKDGDPNARDPKELENLYALAWSYENLPSVVDKGTVYKNDDVRDFLAVRANRDLMLNAPQNPANVPILRERWAAFTAEGKKLMVNAKLTEGDTYTWFWTPWSNEVKVKHGDVETGIINKILPLVSQYSSKTITNKDQLIGRLENELRFEGESGLVIMSPMAFSDALPALYKEGGIDPHVVLDDALATVIKMRDPTKSWDTDDLIVTFDPKQQQWLIYDGTQDAESGIEQTPVSISQDEVDRAIEQSKRKQQISDQEEAARSVVAVAYSQFDDKAEAPSLTMVNTPNGRVGVVNINGFTMDAMLQGLATAVENSVASADLKETARQELAVAKGLGTHFKDDTALRRAVEACTGMNYDNLVTDILSDKTAESELEADPWTSTPHIGEPSKIIAKQVAVQEASAYYANQIKARAGLEPEVSDVAPQVFEGTPIFVPQEFEGTPIFVPQEFEGTPILVPQEFEGTPIPMQYTTGSGDTVNIDELGKITEFILNGVRRDTNPWGEKNLLKDEREKQELKETLLDIGRISDNRLQATVRRITGRNFDDWIDAFKNDTQSEVDKAEAKKDAELKSSINMTDEEHRAKINSLRKPFTIYGTWNKTIFGDYGTEFAKELEKDEGFVVDWVNTRSPKDQKNPKLTQVEIIGLGVVRGGFPSWTKKLEAVRGDADAISRLMPEFAVDYFNNVATKLDAYGFSLEKLQSTPELKITLFALGSFLWHGGKYSNAYYEAMKLARTNLNSALKYLQKTAPYQEAGNARKRRYADGLRAIATMNL